ncbi:winged helix-turn-helix transcriptional regulator [Stappia sp. F7233]|uniref:Winged helix-turn-helix transcriptional regulator n=1 Tax=Stappia albiluteola TaxID=2758565 RepID=A0A839AJM4_9HYPH|nr:MarR family winged helix-turn-helix transcriptional regulator [Stappia albiluteola]MBA5779276.1 winged helix-turn-helix transcriptional regulator [Stappia albiluteola]
MTRLYEQALEGSGITINQFSILSALTQRGPSTATELARYLGSDRTTMTRTLDRMMDSRLVDEVPASDGREHPVAVAPDGQEAMLRANKGWRKAEGTLTHALGRDRVALLWKLLNEVERASD